MNRRFIFVVAAAAAAAGLHCLAQAQETAAPKGEKKTMVFPPGARQPAGGAAEPAPAPSTAPVIKAGTPVGVMLDGPDQIVSNFFQSLRDGKIDEGYEKLTKGSKIAEKPEELRQLKAKTREAVEVFGSIGSYDLVEARNVGRRLLRATYVSLGKVFPLRWRFYFYKPEDTWRLIDLRVDDKLTGIFDEPEDAKAPSSIPTSPGSFDQQ